MKNLIQINFQNIKNVGIRVDFNVPINDSFQITDNTRLIRAKDTIDFVSKNESKILLLSHFGRPKESFDEKFSFKNLIDQFSNILGYEIQLLPYEEFLQNGLQQFKKGMSKITLLDNIRFFEGEKKMINHLANQLPTN